MVDCAVARLLDCLMSSVIDGLIDLLFVIGVIRLVVGRLDARVSGWLIVCFVDRLND